MQVGRVDEGTTNAGSGAEGSSDSGIGVEKKNVLGSQWLQTLLQLWW